MADADFSTRARVSMPCEPGRIISRSALAGPHSLNEPDQPSRTRGTADELHAIIEWLGVDNDAYLRYRTRDGFTFCNIYAHDYCHLAGAYLPRVWWTPEAVEAIRAGEVVEPRYAENLFEQRVNDTFRWLGAFGPEFGWERATDLTELQERVNAGAVGLTVAHRKEYGRPGHITVVVPETAAARALRDADGRVTVPLQSQAGTINFRYDTWRPDWWLDEQFSDWAFWVHP